MSNQIVIILKWIDIMSYNIAFNTNIISKQLAVILHYNIYIISKQRVVKLHFNINIMNKQLVLIKILWASNEL